MEDFWILGRSLSTIGGGRWITRAAFLAAVLAPLWTSSAKADTLLVTDTSSFLSALQGAYNNPTRSDVIQIQTGATINLTGVTPDQVLPMYKTGGATLDVVGNGQTINGGGAVRPFFAFQGSITISNLTIQNGLAQGGKGGDANVGGGGGLGAGGALFVNTGATVVVENVSFLNNQATGGAGSIVGGGANGGSGGGGLGGDGGISSGDGGGGGGGFGGNGGNGIASGGGGGALTQDGFPATGTSSGSGGAGGGANGGAGGAASATVGAAGGDVPSNTVDGGGGGGGGGFGGNGGTGGDGGIFSGGGGGGRNNGGTAGQGGLGGDFGGGGGAGGLNGAIGGDGGFGGGGGGSVNIAGNGGFGGGGGGGTTIGQGGAFGGDGGNAIDRRGGGGGALGGAIFVRDGGSLIIRNSGISGGAVTGGAAGGGTATMGTGFADGIFLHSTGANTNLAFDVTNSNSVAVSDVIGDNNPANGGDGTSSSVTKTGTGVLTLSAPNAYTGGTTVNGGTLSIAGGSLANTSTLAVAGGNFDLGNNHASQTLAAVSLSAGSITGTGTSTLLSTTAYDMQSGTVTAILGGAVGLNKTTAANVTLSGVNTYSGVTTVSAGGLIVNGSIAGDATVNGGFLGGSGTIGGDVLVIAGAAIAPGNSIGMLNIGGNLTQTTGSTYQVEIAPDGTSDLLNVGGTANVGGTVQIIGLGSGFVVGTQYNIVHAGMGVSGTYNGTTDNLPFLDALLTYAANDVFLTLVPGLSYASVAITPNEIAVGNYLDQVAPLAIGGDFATVIDNLNLLNADQARAAYNQMSGEAHATAGQFGVHTTTLMLQQAANHLSSQAMFGPGGSGGPTTNLMAQVSPTSSPAASPIQQANYAPDAAKLEAKKEVGEYLFGDSCANEKLWNGWSVGYGLGGSAQSDGNASGASYGLGGFLAGVDRWLDDSTLVGVFGGYLSSNFSTAVPSANVRDNAGQGGIYALRRGDVFYASALIGGQSDQYTSHRNINFGAIQRTATGNYDGWQGFGYSELGANLSIPGWHRHSCLCQSTLSLQPFGALQYVHLRQNSISETGANSLNLVSGGLDTDSLRSFLGARLRYDNHGDNNFRRIVPELQASWLHEYIDSSTALNTRFGAVGGTNFNVTGLNAGRDWALLGAGLTYVITDNIRLNANYYAQTNDRQTYHVGAGGLSIQW